jgi:hypothetical protein
MGMGLEEKDSMAMQVLRELSEPAGGAGWRLG